MTNDQHDTSAERHLRTTSPTAVAAWQAVDAETAAALLADVRKITADGGEVQAETALHAARYLTGAETTLHAARAARRRAVRLVAMATRETAAGMLGTDDEMVGTVDPARTSLSQYGTTPADTRHAWHTADAVLLAVDLADGAVRPTLARMAVDYLAALAEHAERREAGLPGRPPTLLGATAYREGWAPSTAEYKRSRRAGETALRHVTPGAVLRTMDAEHPAGAPFTPAHPRPTSAGHAGVTPVTAEHPAHGLPGRPALPAVTAERAPLAAPVRSHAVPAHLTDAVDRADRRAGRALAAHMPRVASLTKGARGGEYADPLGYAAWLGYGAEDTRAALLAAERAARAARAAVTAWKAEHPAPAPTPAAVTLPAVPARRPLLPVGTVVVGHMDGGPVSVRPMTDAETETARQADAGRAERGTAPEDIDGDTRPAVGEWAPGVGEGTRGGVVSSGAVPISPTKRAARGQTGPTVPVRLS